MLWAFWAFKHFFELVFFRGVEITGIIIQHTFHVRLFLLYTGSYTAISGIATLHQVDGIMKANDITIL